MGLGLMNKKAVLCIDELITDDEGFSHEVTKVLTNLRVYVEGRHGSERWANLSTFSEATDLFQFRKIPNIEVTTEQYLIFNNHKYEILSVENIKGRNMYIEVLAKKVVPSRG